MIEGYILGEFEDYTVASSWPHGVAEICRKKHNAPMALRPVRVHRNDFYRTNACRSNIHT